MEMHGVGRRAEMKLAQSAAPVHSGGGGGASRPGGVTKLVGHKMQSRTSELEDCSLLHYRGRYLPRFLAFDRGIF